MGITHFRLIPIIIIFFSHWQGKPIMTTAISNVTIAVFYVAIAIFNVAIITILLWGVTPASWAAARRNLSSVF